MSDGIVFFLGTVASLGLIYVWPRGWWFAGVLVTLASIDIGYQFSGWLTVLAGAAFGFAPWVGWWSFTPAGKLFWADAYADPKQSRSALPNMRPQIRS